MENSKKPAGWKGGQHIPGRYFSALKYNANRRGIEFTLSLAYLDSVWIEQKGKCAYSNRTLVLPTKTNQGNASLDRINSNLGYVPFNVQFVDKAVNTMKWNLDEDEFFDLISEISKHIGL